MKEDYLTKARRIRDYYGDLLDKLESLRHKPVYYKNWAIRIYRIAYRLDTISNGSRKLH